VCRNTSDDAWYHWTPGLQRARSILVSRACTIGSIGAAFHGS